MAWLSVYREVAGWLVLAQFACLAVFLWVATARPTPRKTPLVVVVAPPVQVGDDTIEMLGEGGGQRG